ncbi:MAG: YkgJ family cysteine cluster protein [Candidatus Omnitrophica bacterium]|nr:YkgJ family cysteine cluster protein [Candidatus Omnitrophota bacterium]MBU4478999.1 YkgJ family cysteine cluster protein [Candidatus Omnitrophota bacterium]MCG2703794.1 YkgJ family cysteine cluster protein [Candidatus Omnitrophota bacterium]MCG2711293.1 YkgJ family cysteine cluster protein [Candidatus Omnitrophota bacterium]
MIDIKQYTDSSFCLKCRGCCRFFSDIWLPHLLEEDRERLGIEKVVLSQGKSGPICQFLNESDNYCGIYGRHPFECRIYPFLLVRREQTLDLAAHLSCPYVMKTFDSQIFKDYARYLAGLLQSADILPLLKDERHKFHSYPEIELFLILKDVITAANSF